MYIYTVYELWIYKYISFTHFTDHYSTLASRSLHARFACSLRRSNGDGWLVHSTPSRIFHSSRESAHSESSRADARFAITSFTSPPIQDGIPNRFLCRKRPVSLGSLLHHSSMLSVHLTSQAPIHGPMWVRARALGAPAPQGKGK